MEIKISDHILPLFTKYYTLMGRNAYDDNWYHVETGKFVDYVKDSITRIKFDYYKLLEYELETYDDEQLYQLYYRQQKLGRLIDENDEN